MMKGRKCDELVVAVVVVVVGLTCAHGEDVRPTDLFTDEDVQSMQFISEQRDVNFGALLNIEKHPQEDKFEFSKVSGLDDGAKWQKKLRILELMQSTPWGIKVGGRTGDGLKVGAVLVDSSASKSGLGKGDILKEINGIRLVNFDQLKFLEAAALDQEVELIAIRDGNDFSVKLRSNRVREIKGRPSK